MLTFNFKKNFQWYGKHHHYPGKLRIFIYFMMGKYAENEKRKKRQKHCFKNIPYIWIEFVSFTVSEACPCVIFSLLSIFSTKSPSPPILYKRRGKDVTSQTMADGQAWSPLPLLLLLLRKGREGDWAMALQYRAETRRTVL